jgi:hypothetical protein
MFEKFFSATSADFRQRYEGTFGFYTVDGTRKFLALLEHIDQEEKTVSFSDKKGTKYQVNADIAREIGFEFLPPASAFYNTSDGLFFMERHASRQFKRGVCSANMRAYKVTERGFNPVHIDFSSLLPVYEKALPFKETVGKFNCYAISPSIAITPFGICVFKEIVGSVLQHLGRIELNKSGNMFLTEIKDALRNCEQTMEIHQYEKT